MSSAAADLDYPSSSHSAGTSAKPSTPRLDQCGRLRTRRPTACPAALAAADPAHRRLPHCGDAAGLPRDVQRRAAGDGVRVGEIVSDSSSAWGRGCVRTLRLSGRPTGSDDKGEGSVDRPGARAPVTCSAYIGQEPEDLRRISEHLFLDQQTLLPEASSDDRARQIGLMERMIRDPPPPRNSGRCWKAAVPTPGRCPGSPPPNGTSPVNVNAPGMPSRPSPVSDPGRLGLAQGARGRGLVRLRAWLAKMVDI